MDSLSRHTDYGQNGLAESEVADDPMAQFRLWLTEAEQAGIYEPNAMVVGTIGPDGHPSSRTVLLKGVDDGFEFVTNYESRKGLALLRNPGVTLLFPWYSIKRQVIIAGTASVSQAEVSDEYFAARPRDSQIASAASDQSRPIASRSALEERVREVASRHPDDAVVDRPANWGAFRVEPRSIEFWQGRTSRLHDRLMFTRAGSNWTMERLQP